MPEKNKSTAEHFYKQRRLPIHNGVGYDQKERVDFLFGNAAYHARDQSGYGRISPIYGVRNINAKDVYGSWRCCSNVTFGYYGVYTKIYYYENNVMTNMRYVSFNNSKEVISEWEQDSTGLISVQASTNWKNMSATGTSNYVKETCTYYHKSLPLNDDGINENGGELTYTISDSSLEVENHQNYSFAIIFKVVTGDMDDEIFAGLNLRVKIGNDAAQNIILNNGGSTYIVIPCDYYSSETDVVITNCGSEYVVIQYFGFMERFALVTQLLI